MDKPWRLVHLQFGSDPDPLFAEELLEQDDGSLLVSELIPYLVYNVPRSGLIRPCSLAIIAAIPPLVILNGVFLDLVTITKWASFFI